MTDTTTPRRTPAERAQDALDVCDRRIARNEHRLALLRANATAIETELAALRARREYLAANPDLPDQNDEGPTEEPTA